MQQIDRGAISESLRYFDYNLNAKDKQQPGKSGNANSAPANNHPSAIKVHQSEMHLVGLKLRVGHLDQALVAVLEAIRIA